jgi:C4-dicarboxylate-specific signal transduction histidine kinase
VTQRRISEQELGKLQSDLANAVKASSLGVMTASVAHEVNQPLAGIATNVSTCLRMLAADTPNINGARETIRRALRDVNRASEIVMSLRTLFARKGSVTESVDLNEATQEVIALSRSELQRGRIVLRSEFAADLPPVTGDRIQLQQVIMNLLRNALDSMRDMDDRPRELVVKTERDEDDCVRLIVQDSGSGFGAQGANKLFEAFYSTKPNGMGIGLSVSRSIIESHHGHLWAEQNQGSGATFSFAIPRSGAGSRGPFLGAMPALALRAHEITEKT